MILREADEGDVGEIVAVYTYGECVDDRLERVRRFGWWGDEEALAWYLKSLRRTGGISVVAVEEDKIVGEAEIAPDRGPSLVGEHAFLLSLWTHPKYRGRGVGKALLDRCLEIARGWGFRVIDTIPIPGSERFFSATGFSRVARQVVAEADSRPTPGLAGMVSLGPGDFPSNLCLLAGHVRPGRLSWELLWGQAEVGLGLPSPKAFRVRVGSWNFALLLYAIPSRDGPKASAMLWGEPRVGVGQVFDAVEVSLRIASEAGFGRVRAQLWEKFMPSFSAAGFEEMERRPWVRKEIRRR